MKLTDIDIHESSFAGMIFLCEEFFLAISPKLTFCKHWQGTTELPLLFGPNFFLKIYYLNIYYLIRIGEIQKGEL